MVASCLRAAGLAAILALGLISRHRPMTADGCPISLAWAPGRGVPAR